MRRSGLCLQACKLLLVTVGIATLPACESGGHFSFLGYTTRHNYDHNIRTVRVPVFKTKIVEDSVRRWVEQDLTQAVVREIELRTPWKVVGPNSEADVELTGTVTSYNKQLLNRNQLNEIREGETVLGVEVVWTDLRTGECLSQPKRRGDVPPEGGPPQSPPTLVMSKATFIPELGQSFFSARQINTNQLARRIVSMMENPW